jgi:hypothetical protein
LRCGDSLLTNRTSDAASAHYQRAAEIWQKTGAACGLALAAYRRAELAQNDPRASLTLLEESLAWLEKSPPTLQTGPRAIVQNALARIKKRQPGPWGAWHWQPFEDLAYITLLMPMF